MFVKAKWDLICRAGQAGLTNTQENHGLASGSEVSQSWWEHREGTNQIFEWRKAEKDAGNTLQRHISR